MRIAYLTQTYPPMISGAAIVAEGLARQMAARGHQVLVLAASDKGHMYTTLEENLSVYRLHAHRNPMRVGHKFMLYPRHAVMNTLYEFKPDIIHTHEPLQMGLLGLEYAQRAHTSCTLTTHQLPWFAASYLPARVRPWAEMVLWAYARWLLKRFTAIIAPSETIAKVIVQMTGHRAAIIGYGLNMKIFHPKQCADQSAAIRQKWNLPPNIPLILHVGRLDADKQVDRVILAAALAFQQSEAHLVIVGDGQQRKHLIQLCENLGIAHRVHFTGYIRAEQDLPEIYRTAALFVTASEIETQGIVLLEAAASGLPIVAVRATCIPEIVHHGTNGYLADPGDTAMLGKFINTILADLPLAQNMGAESRKLAENHST